MTCYARDEYGRGIIEHFITAAQVASGETLAVGSQWDVESLIGSAVTMTIEQDGKIKVGSMDGFWADGVRHAGVSFPVLGAGKRHASAKAATPCRDRATVQSKEQQWCGIY